MAILLLWLLASFCDAPRDNLNSSLSKVCNTVDEVGDELNNIVQVQMIDHCMWGGMECVVSPTRGRRAADEPLLRLIPSLVA